MSEQLNYIRTEEIVVITGKDEDFRAKFENWDFTKEEELYMVSSEVSYRNSEMLYCTTIAKDMEKNFYYKIGDSFNTNGNNTFVRKTRYIERVEEVCGKYISKYLADIYNEKEINEDSLYDDYLNESLNIVDTTIVDADFHSHVKNVVFKIMDKYFSMTLLCKESEDFIESVKRVFPKKVVKIVYEEKE